MNTAPSILIVEDEVAIRELVGFVCETEGCSTYRAGSVAEAQQLLDAHAVDLILLDCMLPDRSGLDWLKSLRGSSRHGAIPVIMLTARGDESDRVAGLDAGADDYVVKPFLPRELSARIRAVLRRHQASQGQNSSGANESEGEIHCGPLMMNAARFEALVNGAPVKLSAKEFKLLYLFASKPGRVFTREMLLESVWPGAFVDERTVDVHMLRLRKALAGTRAENLIETVRGVGYRLRSEDVA